MLVPRLWLNTSSSSYSSVSKWYARPCKSSLHLSLLLFYPHGTTWDSLHMSYPSRPVCPGSCFSWKALLSHIEFLLIFWASAQIPSLLGMSCSLLSAAKASVCILLAAPWCSLSCFIVLWTGFFLIKRLQAAQGPRSYFGISRCSAVLEIVSSLLNQQMEGMTAAKADAPPWPLMLKLISLSDGGTETGKVLLPASTWGRWWCYMTRGMQMWVLWHWHLTLWSPSTGALLHFSDACLPSLSSPQETWI